MSAPIVQAQYEELEQIAARFAAAAEQQQALQERVNRQVEVLRSGSWQGKGVAAFLSEMDGEVGPAEKRLSDSLYRASETTLSAKLMLFAAEQKAAQLFQNREQATPLPNLPLIVFDPNGDPMSLPVGEVPPRVYPTNGINNDGSGNVALRNYLVSYGYPSDQVVVLPAIYSTDLAGKWNRLDIPQLEGTRLSGTKFENKFLSPLNWLTNHTANAVNNVTRAAADGTNLITSGMKSVVSGGLSILNTGIGITQVYVEYQTGGFTETYKIEQAILQDLKNNPLMPGQKIIMMGHSGGPASNANAVTHLSGMLTQRSDGSVSPLQVEAFVSLGSPVFNRDAVSKLTHVVEIKHESDFVGLPLLRSDERRSILHDVVDRDWNSSSTYTIKGSYPGLLAPHTDSYFDIGSSQLANILNQHFGLDLAHQTP